MFDSRNLQRPPSPVKVLWFEFLLNPNILEQHLSEVNPDPGPTDLIIKFLANSINVNGEQSNNTTSNQHNSGGQTFGNGSDDHTMDGENNKESKESKKKLALKLLALKVAAYLKWDLNTLEKKLSLIMQQALLTELLKVTGGEQGFNETNAKDITPEAQFAYILYYTWILRAVIEGSYPMKSQKGLNIQLPGQADPSVMNPAVTESILRKLGEESEKACAALEKILLNEINVRMPLINCFTALVEECPNPDHKWELGIMLKPEDVICQISYDLGRFYFFQEKYAKASGHFIRASELHSKIKEPVICQLNVSKLKGFYDACAHILGYQTSDSSTPLRESLQTSVKEDHNKTADILKTDNLKRELPLALRDAIELNIMQEHEKKIDLLLYVVFSNAVRRTLSGEVIFNNWNLLFKIYEEKSSLILVELIKDAIPSATPQMKLYLKNFARSLCLSSIPAKQLMKKYEK